MLSLFEKIATVENLYEAWRKVRANRGVGGIDSISIKDFEEKLQENLIELSRNLLSKTYQPLPVRFVRIMKKNGKMRELGILTVRDRVAQRAVLDAVEDKFESEMQECNFAFRPGRNVEMAIQQILVCRANGLWWTVEADIKDYFGSINREILTKDISRIIDNKEILRLIDLWINSGILEDTRWFRGQRKLSEVSGLISETLTDGFENLIEQKVNTDRLSEFSGDEFAYVGNDNQSASSFSEDEDIFENEVNKNQAKAEMVKVFLKDGFWLVMSHRALLGKVLGTKVLGAGGLAVAGIFLAPKIIEKYREYFHPRRGILQGSPLSPVLANLYLTEFDKSFAESRFRLIRYCDDFVIVCRTKEDAAEALKIAGSLLAKRGLEFHPDKTKILSPKDPFDFLGYRFQADGTVEPPPTATNKLAKKIRNMSKSVSAKFKGNGTTLKEKFKQKRKFKIRKPKVNSWSEFFEIFGKGDQ